MAESQPASPTPSLTTPGRSSLSTPFTSPSCTPLRYIKKPPKPALTLKIPKTAAACVHCKLSDLRGCSLLNTHKLDISHEPCTRCARSNKLCIVQGQVEEKGGMMKIFHMMDGTESEEAKAEGERVWEILLGKAEKKNWILPSPWSVRKSLKRWELDRMRGDRPF